MDFVECNGQNKRQTQSEELKELHEIPAGWVSGQCLGPVVQPAALPEDGASFLVIC